MANWGKGMQAFATHVNEIIKIGVALRFHYNHKGWAAEFEYPDTRQHKALVQATIDRSNTIISEYMNLGEYVLEPSGPVKKTPVRGRNGGLGNRLPPQAAAREFRAPRPWPHAQSEVEEEELLEGMEEGMYGDTGSFMPQHNYVEAHGESCAQDKLDEVEAEEEALKKAAKAQELAERQKKRAEHLKKEAVAKLARADNINAALLAARRRAEQEAIQMKEEQDAQELQAAHEAEAARLREGEVTQEVNRQRQAQANRGGSLPARGPGSRGGRIPKSNRDSVSVDRSTTSTPTPTNLESMGGNVKKVPAPAVKAESIPPESVAPTPTKKKTPAKANVRGEATLAPKAPKAAAAPKTTSAKKETTAKGVAAKAKDQTPRKRASPKKRALGNDATATPEPKKKRPKKDAETSPSEDVKAGHTVQLSIKNSAENPDNGTSMDSPAQTGDSMAPIDFNNAQQKGVRDPWQQQFETQEQFEQFLQENAFEGGNEEHVERFFRGNGNGGGTQEQTELGNEVGIDVDALLTFDGDESGAHGSSEELAALLRENGLHGEEAAINDTFGSGQTKELGSGHFKPDNIYEGNMTEQAENAHHLEGRNGENVFEIAQKKRMEHSGDFVAMPSKNAFQNNNYVSVEPSHSFETVHNETTFNVNNAEDIRTMQGANGMFTNGVVEKPARTNSSLSEDQFWDAKPGPVDSFDALLGENTFVADMGDSVGNGDMDFMFQD